MGRWGTGRWFWHKAGKLGLLVPWKADEFTTFVEEFGGSYSIGAFTVLAAFLRHSFGRAQVHPTFLGAQGPAFPNVGYAVEGANWSYVKLLGDMRTPRRALTPGEGQEEFKRLGLHYLRLTPWEPLTISVARHLSTLLRSMEISSTTLCRYCPTILPSTYRA